MRRVWFDRLGEVAEILEELGGHSQYGTRPELPPGDYGEWLWAYLQVQDLRLDWHGVDLWLLTSESSVTRELFPPELVLEVGDEPAGMTGTTVRITTASLARVVDWYERRYVQNIESAEADRESVLRPLRDAFDALAVLSDTLPPPKPLTLPAFGEVLRCRACRSVLTKPMLRVDPSPVFASGRSLPLHAFHYGIIDERLGREANRPVGFIVTSIDGLVDTLNLVERNVTYEGGFHPEEELPNEACGTCRAPIGEHWQSDWFGRFCLFSPELVELVPSASLDAGVRARLYAYE